MEKRMSEIIEISEENFDHEVLNSMVPVLVDFSAGWCGPCKMLEPVVEEMAAEWGGSVKVVRLDVDHSPNIAMNYQIMGVPTLMLFRGGQALERVTGYLPKPRIMDKFSVHI